jgi:hypothetical protein
MNARSCLIKLASESEEEERRRRLRAAANMTKDVAVPTAVGAGAGLLAGAVGGSAIGAGMGALSVGGLGYGVRQALRNSPNPQAASILSAIPRRTLAVGTALGALAGGAGGALMGAQTLLPLGALAGAGVGGLNVANKAATGQYKGSSPGYVEYNGYEEPPSVLGGTARGALGGAAIGAGVGAALLGARGLARRFGGESVREMAELSRLSNPARPVLGISTLGFATPGAIYGGVSASRDRRRRGY